MDKQEDPLAFLTWLLNNLQIPGLGDKDRSMKKNVNIIAQTFQGKLEIASQKIASAAGGMDPSRMNHEGVAIFNNHQ